MNDRQMKDSSHTPTTSEGLLREAASPNSPRREEFARLYSAIVRRYVECAAGAGVSPEDRDDIAQDVMVSVWKALPGFRHDRSRGRFRGYLRSSVSHALAAFAKRFRPADRTAPDPVDPDTLAAAEPDVTPELQWRIWTLAFDRIQRSGRFEPNSLAMFRRFVVDGLPAAAVAAEFKTNPNAVYQCKNRVMSAVHDELRAFGHGRSSLLDLCEALEAAAESEDR
jgi:DNA-directed RNA polymerase specialized sigma24 family protein